METLTHFMIRGLHNVGALSVYYLRRLRAAFAAFLRLQAAFFLPLYFEHGMRCLL